MHLLILGGTHFLGRHIAATALAADHRVTLFNRGRSAPQLFPEAEHLRGDRNGDLSALAEGRWDAVIDTSGRQPEQVRASADLLRDSVDHYVFISTISVYADNARAGQDESASLKEPITPAGAHPYGHDKVACELAVDRAFPNRSLILRPGVIGGPWDPTHRLTYWVMRIAEGGAVLVPGSAQRQIQVIDVRDLAHWAIQSASQRKTGIYNATGPATPLTMGGLFDECCRVSGSGAKPIWVPDEFLLTADVAPWRHLPLWLPASHQGFLSMNSSRAFAAGLQLRPMAKTLASVLTWGQSQFSSTPRTSDDKTYDFLNEEREAALIASWQRQSAR